MKRSLKYISPLACAVAVMSLSTSCEDPTYDPGNLNPNTPKPEPEPEPEVPDTITGPQRNILLIMADDFNFWNGTNPYYPNVITPNIDTLASKGVLFTHAMSASPVSNPSRNALWSGVRPCTSGIWSNGSVSNGGGYIRDVAGFENVVTMNQYFMQNGYHVLGAGKLYHPGSMDPNNKDTDPDNWSQVLTNRTGSSATGGTHFSWTNPGMDDMKIKVGNDDPTPSNTADLKLVNDVAAFLTNYETSEHANKPFFVGCGIFRPHIPWNFSKKYWDMYEGHPLAPPIGYRDNDLADINGAKKSSSHTEMVAAGMWQNAIRAYLSCLTMTDEHVGILIRALNKTKYKDNTVIVFVGDHGWHLGEKDRWSKYAVYSQANMTSLVIYDPASQNTTNHICSHPVSMQDLYPTLVKLANIPRNPMAEGNDISPLVEDPNLQSWGKPVMCSYGGTHYIQDKKFRFVSAGENSQLYKIDTDPYEFNNLFGLPGYEGIQRTYQAKIDSIRAIGQRMRMARGLSAAPGAAAHVSLPYNCPQSVADLCKNRQLSERNAVQSFSAFNGTITLDLLYADPFTEVALISKDGKILDKQHVAGEMTTTLKTAADLSKVHYVAVIDQDIASVETLEEAEKRNLSSWEWQYRD